MPKLIVNLSCGLLILFVIYNIFYFRMIPRMVAHFRKVIGHQRKYDKEIEEILKEPEEEKS